MTDLAPDLDADPFCGACQQLEGECACQAQPTVNVLDEEIGREVAGGKMRAYRRPPPDESEDYPPQTVGMRFLTRAELATLPQPEPLIDDTLDLRTVAMLAGYWGTGKSFLALDWAACIATGKPWQGRPVTEGRVLYVATEGPWGLHQRLSAWEYAWRHDIAPNLLEVLPEPVNLLDRAAVADLAPWVKGTALVVLDTIAKCAVGGDENSARDMGMVVDALYTIRDATNGGTVLAVHHTGKDRTTVRGSSALEAGVDTVYQVEGDARLIKLARTKRRDGPRDDEHLLSLRPTLESVVVESAGGSLLAAELAESEDHLLTIVRDHFGTTGATGRQLLDTSGLPKSTHYRALNALLKRGLLHNSGTDKRPFYVLAGDPDDE
jgi:hypothetical protein